MNPYAPHLGEREPLAVIAETPAELNRLFHQLGPGRLTVPPAPEKWSPLEILCHLADTEIAFAFRLRQAIAEDNHVIQPFDQNAWAKSYGYADAGSALDVFSALRRWNVAFIRSLMPDALSRPVTHPERGEMTFQTLIETMAGHDINHLQHMNAIAGRRAATP